MEMLWRKESSKSERKNIQFDESAVLLLYLLRCRLTWVDWPNCGFGWLSVICERVPWPPRDWERRSGELSLGYGPYWTKLQDATISERHICILCNGKAVCHLP
jgi:hypothetical protein